MKLVVIAIFLGVFNGVLLVDPMRFDNSSVFSVAIESLSQLSALQALRPNGSSLYFLDEPTVGHSVQVIVPKSMQIEFDSVCDNNRIDNKLLIEDVQELIDAEMVEARDDEFHFDHFHRIDKIYAWLDSLADKHPSIVTRIKGGDTYEGRSIEGVLLSKNKSNPAIFIDSNIHAREWLASATTNYLINKLLTSHEPEVQHLLNNYNWYIFPVTNPDGYEYSHTTNRMWRKTRSPQANGCFGVDPNRNWGYEWQPGGIGASDGPCSESFAGTSAFSEIEVRTLSQFMATVPNLKVYLSFHSAHRALVIPFGFTEQKPYHYDQLMEVAKAAVDRLKALHGVQYLFGPAAKVIYPSTGLSLDWTYAHLNVTWSFAYEFRDRTVKHFYYGFESPPEEIKPNADETIQSLIGMMMRIEKIEKLYQSVK